MKKISALIAGKHQTSISLEEEFYNELLEIAAAGNMSRNRLITMIDRERKETNLSSAIRLYILRYYKERCIAAKKQP